MIHQISLNRQEDVLICDQCSAELKTASNLRKHIRDYDELYFTQENEIIEDSVNEVSQGRPKGLRVTAKKNYMSIHIGSESKRLPMKNTERNAHRPMQDLELQDKAQQKKLVIAGNDEAKQEDPGEDNKC